MEGEEMAELAEEEQYSSPIIEPQHDDEKKSNKALQRSLLVLSFILLVGGGCSGPLLLRLYFVKGGRRKWLSSWLESAAWPIILLPLAVSYYFRRKRRMYLMTRPILLASAGLGVLSGGLNFLYAYGVSCLPASTASLLISTQIGFVALFALVLVRQKFTAYSVNAVVLLTLGAVVLGVNSSGDRPDGEGRGKYYLGFGMTLAAAVLNGLLMPLVEMVYAGAEQEVTFTLVTEIQMVVGIFATAVTTVGMVISRDFQVIAREAAEFELGETRYYLLLVCTAIIWQLFFLGTVGVIFYASALLAGVVTAALIPVIEVLSVLFFHESFTGNKGIALALSLWGFASYFYGEFKMHKKISNETNPNS